MQENESINYEPKNNIPEIKADIDLVKAQKSVNIGALLQMAAYIRKDMEKNMTIRDKIFCSVKDFVYQPFISIEFDGKKPIYADGYVDFTYEFSDNENKEYIYINMSPMLYLRYVIFGNMKKIKTMKITKYHSLYVEPQPNLCDLYYNDIYQYDESLMKKSTFYDAFSYGRTDTIIDRIGLFIDFLKITAFSDRIFLVKAIIKTDGVRENDYKTLI